MKKLLIGILVLASVSSFANDTLTVDVSKTYKLNNIRFWGLTHDQNLQKCSFIKGILDQSSSAIVSFESTCEFIDANSKSDVRLRVKMHSFGKQIAEDHDTIVTREVRMLAERWGDKWDDCRKSETMFSMLSNENVYFSPFCYNDESGNNVYFKSGFILLKEI